MAGYLLGEQAIRELGAVLRSVPHARPYSATAWGAQAAEYGIAGYVFAARITGWTLIDDDHPPRYLYAWEQIGLDDDFPSDRREPLIGTLSADYALNIGEMSGGAASPLGIGSVVMLVRCIDDDGRLRYLFASGGGQGGMFQVRCAVDGGDGGTGGSTVCTYTYSLYGLGDDPITSSTPTLATLRTPYYDERAARWNGIVYAAPAVGTLGLAYYDGNGDLQLWSVPERPTTILCNGAP